MHPNLKLLLVGVLEQRQCLGLAARNRNAAAVPIIVQVIERVLAQLETARAERFRVAEGETELEQVDPPHAHRVEAREKRLHRGERAGNHRHLNHDVRQRGHSSRHALEHGRIRTRDVFGLHAEADLIKPRLRELLQTHVVKQIATRV